MPLIDDLFEIKRLCLTYLSAREHSRQELIQKIVGKNYLKPAIESVLDELASEGWQSDDRFAEQYARQRVNKGFGQIRVNMELQQKGVKDFDWSAFSEQLDINWQEVIEQAYIKKYTLAPLIAKKEWAKQVRYLQYRGFPLDLIRDLFDRLNIRVE